MTNKIDKKLEKILKRHLKIKSLSDLKKIKKLKLFIMVTLDKNKLLSR